MGVYHKSGPILFCFLLVGGTLSSYGTEVPKAARYMMLTEGADSACTITAVQKDDHEYTDVKVLKAGGHERRMEGMDSIVAGSDTKTTIVPLISSMPDEDCLLKVKYDEEWRFMWRTSIRTYSSQRGKEEGDTDALLHRCSCQNCERIFFSDEWVFAYTGKDKVGGGAENIFVCLNCVAPHLRNEASGEGQNTIPPLKERFAITRISEEQPLLIDSLGEKNNILKKKLARAGHLYKVVKVGLILVLLVVAIRGVNCFYLLSLTPKGKPAILPDPSETLEKDEE